MAGKRKPLVQMDLDTGEFVVRDQPQPRDWGTQKGSVMAQFTEGGAFDIDRMKPDSVAKLRAAIASTPGFGPQAEAESGPPPEVVSASMAGHLWGFVGALESLLAVRVWGISESDAERIFRYNEQEIGVLAEPTAAVLNKYAGALMRWKEELALGLAVLAVHQAKMQLLRAAVMEQSKDQAAQVAEEAKGTRGPVNGIHELIPDLAGGDAA